MMEEFELETVEERCETYSEPVLRRQSTLANALYRPRTLSIHRNTNRTICRASGGSPNWIHAASHFRHLSIAEQVSDIVDKIEEHQSLLNVAEHEANHFSNHELRSMPQSLTTKRKAKQRLSISQQMQRKLSHRDQIRYNVSMSMRKAHSHWKDFLYVFDVWYSTLKTIEGEFGSATASYFRFFRLLICLNATAFILCFFFISLPQIICPSTSYEANMTATPFAFIDIFTGEGYFTHSIVFYGGYSNGTIELVDNVSYSMPRGYFYTMLVVYLTTFLILARRTAVTYRLHFIETKSGLKTAFAQKIFCNWDFSIATQKASRLKSVAIYQELKELVGDKTVRKKVSLLAAIGTFLFRVITNCMAIAIILFVGYGLWKMFDYHLDSSENKLTGVSAALAVNAIIHVVPRFFIIISKYEDYVTSRKAFTITLIRTYLLAAIVVGALVGFWLYRRQAIVCWETSLGQEVYRLMLFDFIFTFIFFILDKGCYLAISKLRNTNINLSEFEVATYTLHLIYNQAIFWLGLLYAPLLSAVNVIKSVSIWYFFTKVVIKCCNPSTKFWRASSAQSVIFLLTFLTMLSIMAVLGGLMAKMECSTCGPFRGHVHMYEFVINEFDVESFIWKLITYGFKPGSIALIIISLIGFNYYLHEKAFSQTKLIKLLREMIVNETKDKEFVLKRIHHLDKEGTLHNDASEITFRRGKNHSMKKIIDC